MVKVTANRQGYYGNVIRNPGDEFHVEHEDHLGDWMTKVAEQEPEVEAASENVVEITKAQSMTSKAKNFVSSLV